MAVKTILIERVFSSCDEVDRNMVVEVLFKLLIDKVLNEGDEDVQDGYNQAAVM